MDKTKTKKLVELIEKIDKQELKNQLDALMEINCLSILKKDQTLEGLENLVSDLLWLLNH